MDHAPFMHRCLALAEKGRGHVGNGAFVGAVLVREGNILAEGYHMGWGNKHAERILLENFDQELYSTDTLYVNLEPCCHHGKTPPCTDIILEKGIRRVVYGMQDPDPRVAGSGIARLHLAGVEIIGPVERSRSEWLNRGFVNLRKHGRPWITQKIAKTKDGKIAHPDGSPLKITSESQDIWTHTFLRARHDAILVGVQTVVHDNPILNTRLVQVSADQKAIPDPYRLILDPHLRIPSDARILCDDHSNRTMMITWQDADQKRMKELRARDIRIIALPRRSDSLICPELWRELLTPDGEFYGITSILVEGGEKTWNAFRKEGCVDEEVSLMG